MNEQIAHAANELAFGIDSWALAAAIAARENLVAIDARSPEARRTSHARTSGAEIASLGCSCE